MTPLVNQPSANPTRKWTAARIAEAAVTVITAATLVSGAVDAIPDLNLTEDQAEKIAAGIALAVGGLVWAAGAIAGWLTRNRATVVEVSHPSQLPPSELPPLT